MQMPAHHAAPAKGSFVGAWLSALSGEDARDFEADYRRQIAAARRACDDGVTLFPFRRFFRSMT